MNCVELFSCEWLGRRAGLVADHKWPHMPLPLILHSCAVHRVRWLPPGGIIIAGCDCAGCYRSCMVAFSQPVRHTALLGGKHRTTVVLLGCKTGRGKLMVALVLGLTSWLVSELLTDVEACAEVGGCGFCCPRCCPWLVSL